MTELITRMAMGQDVPDWLISADPMTPGAPRGHMRFAIDVDVIDLPSCYLVLPLQGGAYPIDVSGMGGHRVYATAKNVVLVLQQAGFMTLQHSGWQEALPGTIVPASVALDAVRIPETRLSPAPHPTFWRRLVYAFRGR